MLPGGRLGFLGQLPAWAGHGTCASAGQLTVDFHVEEDAEKATETVNAAKGRCLVCPVRELCFDYAQAWDQAVLLLDDRSIHLMPAGIYGGLTPEERHTVTSYAQATALLHDQANIGDVHPYERKEYRHVTRRSAATG